jgi:hypothetical protein
VGCHRSRLFPCHISRLLHIFVYQMLTPFQVEFVHTAYRNFPVQWYFFTLCKLALCFWGVIHVHCPIAWLSSSKEHTRRRLCSQHASEQSRFQVGPYSRISQPPFSLSLIAFEIKISTWLLLSVFALPLLGYKIPCSCSLNTTVSRNKRT